MLKVFSVSVEANRMVRTATTRKEHLWSIEESASPPYSASVWSTEESLLSTEGKRRM
jgi:hypothetical protein